MLALAKKNVLLFISHTSKYVKKNTVQQTTIKKYYSVINSARWASLLQKYR